MTKGFNYIYFADWTKMHNDKLKREDTYFRLKKHTIFDLKPLTHFILFLYMSLAERLWLENAFGFNSQTVVFAPSVTP